MTKPKNSNNQPDNSIEAVYKRHRAHNKRHVKTAINHLESASMCETAKPEEIATIKRCLRTLNNDVLLKWNKR